MRSERRALLARVALVVALVSVPAGGADATEPVQLTLTGSLRAREAERFNVPLTSNWNLQLTWLAREGEAVAAGEAVARFEAGGIADQLATAEESLAERRQQRVLAEGEGKLQRLQHELELRRAEIGLKKAAIDADVPADVIDGVEYRTRQLELARAETRLADARTALATHGETHRATMTGHVVETRRLRARIERLERELDSLELVATRPGVVVHETHPWFGRKVREGDNLQANFPVASIPDAATLEVEAWATEIDLPRLAPGLSAVLSLDAYPGRPFSGRIESIGNGGRTRDDWGRTPYFRVRIELDQLDVALMRPGMSVRCEIDVDPAEIARAGGDR